MKKMKFIIGACAFALIGIALYAADHIDAPEVAGGSSDIADFYAFEGETSNNIVFVATLQGLLSPTATQSAKFDENVMVQFNIDTNNDYVEDYVIQAVPRNGKMYFFGPYMPSATGLNSTLPSDDSEFGVDITPYGASAIVGTKGASKYFAGPRDDPFFMDIAQYGEIIGGRATSFNNPGVDTFAGTNVLSIVVEVPKSLIGGTGTINTWVASKVKQ